MLPTGWIDAARRVGAVLVVAILAGACGTGGDAALCPPARVFSDEVAELTVAPLGDPVWTMTSDEETFSSPRAVDLNDDGVLDVVQGFGQDTFGASESSVVATDGATGMQLWRSGGQEDLVGSATFASLGGDDTPDVVMGGRRGALVALDGSTGAVLWAFDDQGGRWFNFYTSQIVADQDGDEIVDVVAVNGGLVFDQPEEGGGLPDPDERHLGTMFLLSGADGSVIASMPVPDRGESYMSPVIADGSGTDELDVLIGTGGETLPGSLWRVPLASLGVVASASGEGLVEMIASGGDKGVIATPGLADMTGDCVADIVVQSFDGTVSAHDGASSDELWVVVNEGFETYSTPALGYFVGEDDIPDVFAGVARGVWPEYESSDYLLIDGATGQVVWRETLGTFAPSGFIGADLNDDGRDEVIFGVNDVVANTHQFYVLDAARRVALRLGEPLGQTTFSSPLLRDLDADGRLDLVVTESAYHREGPAIIHRFALPWDTPEVISWGGYLGTEGRGRLVESGADG